MGRLDDKVAIITGAAGGIGKATAETFLKEGAKVMLVDLDEQQLQTVADELGDSENVGIKAADVSEPDQVEAYVDACIDQFGRLDILFDNAGIEGSMKPLIDQSFEEFDRVQKVNLYGCWLGLKYAAPKIAASGGGSIVMTSSVAGIIGSPGLGPYVASKHGVVGLMKSAAQELAEMDIRVNTVNPGPIQNRMMDSIEEQANPDSPDSVQQGFEQMVPMGRYGTNEEVANLVTFLASDESSYCNGSVYMVDGGFTSM